MSVERSPERKKRDRARVARKNAQWAAKSGPVKRYIDPSVRDLAYDPVKQAGLTKQADSK